MLFRAQYRKHTEALFLRYYGDRHSKEITENTLQEILWSHRNSTRGGKSFGNGTHLLKDVDLNYKGTKTESHSAEASFFQLSSSS